MKQRTKKRIYLVLSIVLILAVAATLLTVTGVFASLGDTTSVVSLKDAAVKCEVLRDYSIRNTGNIDAYVRAKVVINWLDEDGAILADAPSGASISIPAPAGWTHIADSTKIDDGYWYFNGTAAPDSVLSFIHNIAYNGGTARVTVMAEAIQSMPDTAVKEAWNVSFANGTWSER